MSGYIGFYDNGYDTSSDDYESDDGSNMIRCSYCPAYVMERNYEQHKTKVHRCKICGNCMPKDALDRHIENKHMKDCNICGKRLLTTLIIQHYNSHNRKCRYCNSSYLENEMNKHIRDSHPLHATIGMIRLEKITGSEFNQLVSQNRIYSDDYGNLFKKL